MRVSGVGVMTVDVCGVWGERVGGRRGVVGVHYYRSPTGSTVGRRVAGPRMITTQLPPVLQRQIE